MTYTLKVTISTQTMEVFRDEQCIRNYLISSAKNGAGEIFGSEKTPRGWHVIRAKIGDNAPANTVFVKRRPTGEIYTPELKKQFPERDWILTRIFWLSGLEIGKNRLGEVDTMRRYVYIHGTPDEVRMGASGSRGCIRMRNSEIIELFNEIPVGSRLFIQE
jgi:L,D-transpeptidase YbiS